MKSITLCCIIVLCFSFINNTAYAQLLISPTKAVFEGRDRVKEVVLINTGDKANTYRVGWSQRKQLETSEYQDLSEQELESFRLASDFIRFSPRQVTLQPGERQVVKLLLRKKSTMENGDYRSHLKFTIIPDIADEEISQSNELGLKLNVFINYSIPVVIRSGEAQESVEVTSAQVIQENNLATEKVSVRVALARNGLYGSYGRLEIKGINKSSGQSVLFGSLNGVNFLHENSKIVQNIPISDPKLFKQQDEVTIYYISNLGERNVLARTMLRL